MDSLFFYGRKAVVFLVLLSLAQSLVFAASEDIMCNEYYLYDGLRFVEFSPDKAEYFPGEEVRMDYTLDNNFGSPLVQGDIKALVLYMGSDAAAKPDDGDIVDDYVAKSGVNIQEGDKYSGTFFWKVPGKAKSGKYAVNVYFSVKQKFDVSGLSVAPSIPAKKISFTVSSDSSDNFYLDRAQTSFNGKKYVTRAPVAEAALNAPSEIKTRLVNSGPGQIDVSYELYSWNDAGEPMTQYGKKETVSGSKDLTYGIPALPAGVYVARITASFSGRKSILKVRFYVKGAKGGFVWAGLDKFPLEKDEKATIAYCYTNFASAPGTEEALPAKMVLKLTDAQGKVIAEDSTQVPSLRASVDAKKFSFVSPGRETKLTLKAVMYDDKGAVMDEAELLYDYSKFLNIKKNLLLSAPDQASDKLSYELQYSDAYDEPLAGDVVVYLSAPDGKVVALKEGPIAGRLAGEFSLAGMAEGKYVLTGIEKNDVLSDKKIVSVGKITEPAPPTTGQVTATTEKRVATTIAPQQKDSPFPWLSLLGLAALIAVGVILFRSKSKEAKK